MIPTPRQLAWQEAGFGVFFHFGINTFNGLEWSDGTLDPATFRPRRFDAAQWIDVARRAGARYVILTAKHHDGFCLWPTTTTRYSVAASPFSRDVVGELAAACTAAGMPLGLYLSPWDRNATCYEDAKAYDDFYAAQLTELCTRYGPLFELWFDGAGSEGREYAWDRFMAIVGEHQPDAMIFNMGKPTIRWVGNESGLATDPCLYDVRSTAVSMFTDDVCALDESLYLPPECDVPIRDGWFWHPNSEDTLKSTEHLLAIWYRSVGLGAGLLLNLSPDRDGLIPDADAARLVCVANELKLRFGQPMIGQVKADGVVSFGRPVTFDHLELREELGAGQRIFSHRVFDGDRVIAAGKTIGIRRWHAFEPITTDRLVIESAGALRSVTAYRTGHGTIPPLPTTHR